MTILIFIVILSQIWLLSYLYPSVVTRRIDYVLTHYPKSEYPKLYPVSVDTIKLIKNGYLLLNYLCIAIGLWLVFNFGVLPDDPTENLNILDDIPLLYGLLQYIPVILLEVVCFKQLKMMRELYKKNNRKAQLHPRKLSDYIHPGYLVLTAITYLGFIFLELMLNDFLFWSDAGIKIATVTLVNVLFIGLAAQNIYGKKRDPFQHNADRFKQTKFTIQTFVFISIFVTIFLVAHSWVNANNHQYAEVLINSLYFQCIALFSINALLGRFKIEELDFNVYKADTST